MQTSTACGAESAVPLSTLGFIGFKAAMSPRQPFAICGEMVSTDADIPAPGQVLEMRARRHRMQKKNSIPMSKPTA